MGQIAEGTIVVVKSSWVNWVALYFDESDPEIQDLDETNSIDKRSGYFTLAKKLGGQLAINFKSGYTAVYPYTTVEDYRDIRKATSKGKWIHRNIIEDNYHSA